MSKNVAYYLNAQLRRVSDKSHKGWVTQIIDLPFTFFFNRRNKLKIVVNKNKPCKDLELLKQYLIANWEFFLFPSVIKNSKIEIPNK